MFPPQSPNHPINARPDGNPQKVFNAIDDLAGAVGNEELERLRGKAVDRHEEDQRPSPPQSPKGFVAADPFSFARRPGSPLPLRRPETRQERS
jgi:hypothetical protein